MEKDDLLAFLRPLIAQSAVEAICGRTFVDMYPDFVKSFYEFNGKVHKLLYGWPGFCYQKPGMRGSAAFPFCSNGVQPQESTILMATV